MSPSPNNQSGEPQNSATLTRIAITMACGFLVIAATTSVAADLSRAIRTTAILLLLAGAATTLGGLAGFLFGIPRSQQGSDANETDSSNNSIRANTNLEQISDWLTKILVGVGLTQLTTIPDKFQQTTELLASALPTMVPGQAQVLVGAIVIFYMISGFLFSFLWTRLFLGNAMRLADSRLADLDAKMLDLEQWNKNQLEQLKNQETADAEALSMVHHALHPGKNEPAPSVDELTQVIGKTSFPVKTAIYSHASEYRKSVWATEPAKVLRTIPVFRALIACDNEEKYHTNFGNLGLALQTCEGPQYSEAEKMLNKAIEIRDRDKVDGVLDYEYSRAICRIQLQSENPHQFTDDDAILSDLNASAKNSTLSEFMKENKAIQAWLGSRNKQIAYTVS